MKIITKISWFVAFFCVLTNISVHASEPSLLYVQGEAKVSSIPDVATIRITVNAEEKTYEATVQNLTARVEKLRQSLHKELDDKQLNTGRLQIRQNKEYQNRTHVFVGYVATQDILIEIPFQRERLNKLLQLLTQSDADADFSLGFKLSDNKQRELQKQAMQEAVIDARKKAETLTAAAGMSLGEVKEIQYGITKPVGIAPQGFKSMSARAESNEPTFHIAPDEVSVHDRVMIIFTMNK